MKTAIIIGDGMGDYPEAAAGNRTPLQAARIPNMRKLAAAGTLHMLKTVPDSLPPGSDVANLGLLGYDAEDNYTGRAPIEAAGAHIPLANNDIAVRCNLVTINDEVMCDYSAGHITTEEARQLIEAVDQELGGDGLKFHPGVSYRHILVWKNGPASLRTVPPHDIPDLNVAGHLPAGEGEEKMRELMAASRKIFENHPVNLKRIAEGKNPATQIWLWGQGEALQLKKYQELYGLTGGMITAVDLLRGLGVLAGLEVVEVEGATGFVDTNYQGKVEAALDILKNHDFVYVHVEAPDECGHLGDLDLKIHAIEAFDEKVVGPVWQELEARGEPFRLAVTMDHRTPVSLKAHSREPVPLSEVIGPVGEVVEEAAFDEFVNGGVATVTSHELIQRFLSERA